MSETPTPRISLTQARQIIRDAADIADPIRVESYLLHCLDDGGADVEHTLAMLHKNQSSLFYTRPAHSRSSNGRFQQPLRRERYSL